MLVTVRMVLEGQFSVEGSCSSHQPKNNVVEMVVDSLGAPPDMLIQNAKQFLRDHAFRSMTPRSLGDPLLDQSPGEVFPDISSGNASATFRVHVRIPFEGRGRMDAGKALPKFVEQLYLKLYDANRLSRIYEQTKPPKT